RKSRLCAFTNGTCRSIPVLCAKRPGASPPENLARRCLLPLSRSRTCFGSQPRRALNIKCAMGSLECWLLQSDRRPARRWKITASAWILSPAIPKWECWCRRRPSSRHRANEGEEDLHDDGQRVHGARFPAPHVYRRWIHHHEGL